MYKSVLLTLLLCIVFTTKSGRSEIYNVNRRKIADDHQSLQIFDCKGWVTLLSPWNKGKIEISSRKLQRRMRKTGKTNIRKKVKVRGMRFARVNGTKEKLRLVPENFKGVCVKPEKQISERK